MSLSTHTGQEIESDWNQASAIVVEGERGQSSPAAECDRSYFSNRDLDGTPP